MTEKHHLIRFLLENAENRGMMATLRRGAGEKPGTCPAMFPIIAPLLPAACSQNEEARYYLIAGLFAYHPKNSDTGNMGSHLRQTGDENKLKATERRFCALLAAQQEDLPNYLRQTVKLLKSADIGVNWDQLFKDVKHWEHPDRFAQRHWANAFWGKEPENDKNTDEKQNKPGGEDVN